MSGNHQTPTNPLGCELTRASPPSLPQEQPHCLPCPQLPAEAGGTATLTERSWCHHLARGRVLIVVGTMGMGMNGK